MEICFVNGKKDRLKIENTIIFFSSSFRLDCLFFNWGLYAAQCEISLCNNLLRPVAPLSIFSTKVQRNLKNYSRACIKTA